MSQLPCPQNNPTEGSPTTIDDICEDPSLLDAGGPGGAAGGVYQNIPDGEVVQDVQDTYVSGQKTGTISEFVIFNGKPIPKEIAVYLRPMFQAAAAEGVTLQVTSGFRTYAEQERLKAEDPYNAARPGYSPHQRGFAVDMNTRGPGQYEWLVKNAYRYGFVRTVIRERWHWEYRGNWPGQQKPVWASSEYRWYPASQFSVVKRNHRCGVADANGGSKNMSSNTRWGGNLGDRHPDRQQQGYANTWVGLDGEHLPDKFDREDPGWDQRGVAPLPPT